MLLFQPLLLNLCHYFNLYCLIYASISTSIVESMLLFQPLLFPWWIYATISTTFVLCWIYATILTSIVESMLLFQSLLLNLCCYFNLYWWIYATISTSIDESMLLFQPLLMNIFQPLLFPCWIYATFSTSIVSVLNLCYYFNLYWLIYATTSTSIDKSMLLFQPLLINLCYYFNLYWWIYATISTSIVSVLNLCYYFNLCCVCVDSMLLFHPLFCPCWIYATISTSIDDSNSGSTIQLSKKPVKTKFILVLPNFYTKMPHWPPEYLLNPLMHGRFSGFFFKYGHLQQKVFIRQEFSGMCCLKISFISGSKEIIFFLR